MVKKAQQSADDAAFASPSGVKESAQQIWLAGLGAFSKAQEEGGKVFEALVKDGLAIQRKTQAVAEEKIAEATTKMASMASEIQTKAGNRWDKLENIFEDRVAKALDKLGVPSAKDIAALHARIDELTKNETSPRSAPARARSAARPAVKKSARGLGKPAVTRKPT